MATNADERQQTRWGYLRQFLEDLHRRGKQDWLPDSAVSTCFKCHSGFTFTVRRHHCRVCGNIFCTRCCAKKQVQIAREMRSLRLCEKCHRVIKAFTADLEQNINKRNYRDKLARIVLYREGQKLAEEDKKGEGLRQDCEEEKRGSKSVEIKVQEEHIRLICKKLCEESGIPGEYADRIEDMVLHAVSTVRPSVTINDSMKLSDYVKIKLMPGKDISASKYVNGVVFTKNVADKKMKTDIVDPLILLISGNLTEGKDDIEIGSFGEVSTTGDYFASKLMKAIASIKPSIIIVEGIVSVPIQEKLRDQSITVFCNVKDVIMERIARLTGTVPCPTADLLSRHLPLGNCKHFFVESIPRTGKEQIARVDRSYSFFEGCIESLGCTLCIAGKNLELLRTIKTALRQMLFFGRDIVLETAFLFANNVNMGSGQVYLVDAIGMDRYISASCIEITKLYLHQGEIQYGTGLTEDVINKKGRRLCGAPARRRLECYGNNDYPFGIFVSSLMSIISEQCPLCQRKRFTHQLIYCNGGGKVKVTAEPNNEQIEEGIGDWGDMYVLKGICKICDKVVTETHKMHELYEYSFARVLYEYFFNDKMTNKAQRSGCSHNAVTDIVRKIYQKDVVISMEYEVGKVYKYLHSMKISRPLERTSTASLLDSIGQSSPSAGQNTRPGDKKLLSELAKHLVAQYEKLRAIISGAETFCKREAVKSHIPVFVAWIKAYQDDFSRQCDNFFIEEEKKDMTSIPVQIDRRRIGIYARRQRTVLQQLNQLLKAIMESCEPDKDAAEEDKQKYGKFSGEASACISEEAWMNSWFQTVSPISVGRGRGAGSVGALSEVSTGEVDFGAIIAATLQSREYTETITEILNTNRSEDTAEAMESQLLSGNYYCIQIETGEKGKPMGVTVFRNYEKCDVNLERVEKAREAEQLQLAEEEKALEKRLTEILAFRRHVENSMANGAEAEPESEKKIETEVGGLMKQMRLEQRYNETTEKTSVYVYCANQFAALRSCLGVDETEYINSLGNSSPWKNVSGGKTKANFIRTADNRYIMKCIKKKEKDLFERNAHQYFKHVCKAIAHDMPSVIVKNLGLYKVRYGRTGSCEVLVMENLCYSITPTVVYDLKGSSKRRYVKKEEKGGSRVLLDTNFKEDYNGEPLMLDEESSLYLHESIHNDTLLLSKLNVMDYSLLAIIDENKKTIKAGILDIFREFNSAELLEYHTKRAINLGEKPTVIEPNSYKQRFREAMKKYFTETSTLNQKIFSPMF